MQSLLELVNNEMAGDSCKQDLKLQKFYTNSIDHLRAQKEREGDVRKRYEAIKI